ncbi:MAG TPA: hypothetical protein VHT27_14565 [Solirubrobacteraceae bacterium]|jgi:hypothetical protein|nr:hypothetical protein [Solirubrobacteraceae bacterium]
MRSGARGLVAGSVERKRRPCARVYACVVVLAGALAGCSSTTPSTYSRAGLEAAGRDLVANLESGRYRRACEDFTSSARMRLAVFGKGGCVGSIAFARAYLAIEGRPRLGQLIGGEIAEVMPRIKIDNAGAHVGGTLEARYEFGRWRFEARPGGGIASARGDLRASLQEVVRMVERAAAPGAAEG